MTLPSRPGPPVRRHESAVATGAHDGERHCASPTPRPAGEPGGGAAGTAAVPTVKPDALVLDLVMAGQSSLDAIPGLLTGTPGLRIVVLTMQEDPGFAREALRLGASGYVLKDAAADELLLALRTIMRGATYLHPTLGAQMAVLEASTSPLTDREIQVLRLLAEGHTNAEISRRLYLSLRTVEAHRGQLRTKLGLHTRAELSSYAREHGLVR